MVDFSDQAIADLVSIREYIARDNPDKATEQADRIIDKCKLLAEAPFIGRPVADGKRELSTARPWEVVYEIKATGPYILRIWHARQDRPL